MLYRSKKSFPVLGLMPRTVDKVNEAASKLCFRYSKKQCKFAGGKMYSTNKKQYVNLLVI
jgi:hypothetical protein